MKKITLSLVITYTLLLFGCASDNLIGEQKPQEKLNTKPATTIVQLEGASSNVAEKGEQTATSRATRAFAPATTSNGITQSNGFIKFINPTDANTQSIKIDVNGSNFRTWLFLCNPAKMKTGWAIMDWDEVKLSADQQKIELSAKPKELTVTWLNGDIGTLETDDSPWYVSAVMGGGVLQQANTAISAVENGTIQNNISFELNFRRLPTITEANVIQAPFVTKWTKLDIKKQNKFSLNLEYQLKGKLVRAKIQEDNNLSNEAQKTYPAGFDFYNTVKYKAYHFQSTLFYQPNLYFGYQNYENADITTGIRASEGNSKDAGMTQLLVPNHPAQDLASSEERAAGNHCFMVWAAQSTDVPINFLPNDVKQNFYTIITPTQPNFIIASKKNDYVGQFLSTTISSQKNGGILSLGQLKEATPNITEELLAKAKKKDPNTDVQLMEHAIPLEALAENNLGFESKTFAPNPRVIDDQALWSRDVLFRRFENTGRDENNPDYPKDQNGNYVNDVNYSASLIRDFPDGYRCPTIWDYTFAFPYPASSKGFYNINPKVETELSEASDFKFSEFVNGGSLRGQGIPEYLNVAYNFGASEYSLYDNNNAAITAYLTWNRYYATQASSSDDKYIVKAVRFIPSLEHITDPTERGLPTQTKYKNHKCAYYYDFSTNLNKPQAVDARYHKAQAYITIRARYIGDALITDEMVQSDEWWNTPFKGEVVREFCATGPAFQIGSGSDKTTHKRTWERYSASELVDVFTTHYLSGTQYGAVHPSNQKEFKNNQVSRRSSLGNYAYPVRPVKTFKRL